MSFVRLSSPLASILRRRIGSVPILESARQQRDLSRHASRLTVLDCDTLTSSQRHDCDVWLSIEEVDKWVEGKAATASYVRHDRRRSSLVTTNDNALAKWTHGGQLKTLQTISNSPDLTSSLDISVTGAKLQSLIV